MTDLLEDIDILSMVDEGLERIESLLKAEDFVAAELIARYLTKVAPDNAKAWQLFGLTLYAAKKYDSAIEALQTAISIDDNPENHNNISLCYLQIRQYDKALVSQNKAVELKPKNANFWNNLALVHKSNGDNQMAIKCFKRALTLDSNNVKTYEGLGATYGQSKMLREAIDIFHRALHIDPMNYGVRVDMAYAHHLLGEWDLAWSYYEGRLEHWKNNSKSAGSFLKMFDNNKAWNGDSLNGKKILVYCEQGAGDYIQFMRFVPALKKLGADVLIESHDSLNSLFSQFGTITSVRNNIEYDYHCSVMSLPYLLKLNSSQYLGDQRYFNIEDKFDYSDYDGKFKIGIVWAGNPGHPNDALRSCHLNNFREIYNLPNVKLFSLQKDLRKRAYESAPNVIVDLASNCEDMKIVDMSSYMTDFYETAKIINGLDLVVTVDTAVLHLAGALGKKTLGLIAFNPDWRWTMEGENTIWYDSVTLLRQESFQDWSIPFNKAKDKINESFL